MRPLPPIRDDLGLARREVVRDGGRVTLPLPGVIGISAAEKVDFLDGSPKSDRIKTNSGHHQLANMKK